MGNSSRTKNTLRNIIFGMSNQIVSLLLSFISRTIFIKVLGVGYLGISGLFSDILMMLSMADLGFGTAMVYSFYKPLAENDHDKIASLIAFYKKVYNFIAAGVAAIGLALVPFLGYIINLNQSISHIKIYYLFFLADTVISYLFVYKTSIINADQKNYIVSKYQMLVNFTKVLLQSIFLWILKNYFIYLIIQIFSTFINNLIASKKANELYPYIKKSNHKLDQLEKKKIYSNMKSIFIYKISSVLLNGTDNTIISILIGTIWVGFYSNYCLVMNAINNFINILYSSATASIGNLIVSERPKKRFEVFKSMQVISLIISTFTTVCLYTLFNNLIYVWIGTKYVLNDYILASIILNFYISGIVHPIWSYREATGLYIQTKYIMLIAAIENLFLSVIMGKFMGMYGIFLASGIAKLTTYFWYEPRLLFKEYFHESVKKYYIPLVFNTIVTIFIIMIIKIVTKHIIIDSWLKLIIKTILVSVFTLVTIIPFYYHTDGFKLLTNKIKSLLR
ncbi:lipopolysaccharide biosynthesis protein [Clostridium tyrobutyricum]|uniref:lipopolysaccharide biosynthesis protein n=1 Tax=Clostridium tyrobutyricum TaxID=1519 RepID=UPI0018A91ACB|nr:transporter [Clostridium tyrobutyricum]